MEVDDLGVDGGRIEARAGESGEVGEQASWRGLFVEGEAGSDVVVV